MCSPLNVDNLENQHILLCAVILTPIVCVWASPPGVRGDMFMGGWKSVGAVTTKVTSRGFLHPHGLSVALVHGCKRRTKVTCRLSQLSHICACTL